MVPESVVSGWSESPAVKRDIAGSSRMLLPTACVAKYAVNGMLTEKC